LLIKTLARKSTLMVKLRINANTDIDMLDTYWGRGQRAKDIKPLLQSLVREGNGTTIDIIHLLPARAPLPALHLPLAQRTRQHAPTSTATGPS
jgi:hypothetical protein